MTILSKPARSRNSEKPRIKRLRPIGAIARPIAKRLIIRAYCRGWLSKEQTQKLFHDLDLGGY